MLPKELYYLYFGNIFCQPFESFRQKKLEYMHPQCSCCSEYPGYIAYERYKKILSTVEFKLDTVVIPEQIFGVTVKVTSKPWQDCTCSKCQNLVWDRSFEKDISSGVLRISDLYNLRDEILNVTVPSLINGNSLSKCFDLNIIPEHIDVKIDSSKHLTIHIECTSTDGYHIGYLKHWSQSASSKEPKIFFK
jgi:hypothetical protein